ncbi:MAG: sugar transferase [Oscillospiraceae bacterium]|jgi:O-antigen biosynthesis protein WbqP|nr:sugar transferase [Oscillospiraceae bacterium]
MTTHIFPKSFHKKMLARQTGRHFYAFKRAFDFCAALAAIVLSGWLMALIALLIFAEDGAPALFRQERMGRGEKLFTLYKFRSMRRDAPNVASKELKNPQKYMLRIGKILRKTSLDELPQLFNILRGEMSFIGPRPLIPAETEIRRLRRQYGVYTVRPGVTGWAQVNGRDKLPIKHKAMLDKFYIDHMGVYLDLRIIKRTVFYVFERRGISH